MQLLIAFACLWAVAVAQEIAPPPGLIPPPPVPGAPPLGALTTINHMYISAGLGVVAHINAFQKDITEKAAAFFKQNGGIHGDLKLYYAYINQLTASFWQTVQDNLFDLKWDYTQEGNKCLVDIEREFKLVINDPVVRSHLRLLRDINRTSLNRALAYLDETRTKFYALSDQLQQQGLELIERTRCQPDQQRQWDDFNAAAIKQFLQILGVLAAQIAPIVVDSFQQTLTQANFIYQAEIQALHYFVS